jgi:hypothetical protein
MDRYAGRPLLRLLECYVLSIIGHLGEKETAALSLMTPKLGAVYGMTGSWREIVAKQLELPGNFHTQVKNFWTGYQAHVKAQGVPADPNEFAMSFVDQNFPDMVA